MYIGNNLQVANPSYKIIDDISSGFNGSTTSFALQVSGATPVPFPISTQQVMISVNGVIQEPDPSGSAGFKLLGSNIVFSSAPANGHAFFGTILAGADYVTAGSEFPDGSVTAPSFTFEADQDTGWYRIGGGSVGYSSNGVQTLNFDGNGLTIASGKGLTVDTNTLHVDATNNRVGIGTTSATSSLHVSVGSSGTNSSAGFNEFCIEGANEDIGMCFLSPAANNRTHTIAFGDSNNNNAGKIQYNHSTDDLTITASDNIILTGRAVGIGVTPNANWPSNGDFKGLQIGTGGVLFGRGSGDEDRGGIAANWYQTGSGNKYLGNGNANRIYMQDGNITFEYAATNSSGADAALTFVESMKIDSSGRLLVGHTASEAMFYTGSVQVQGTNSSTSAITIKTNQNDSGGPALVLGKSRGAVGSATAVNDDDVLGSIFFNGADGTDTISYGAEIRCQVDGTPGSNDMPGRLAFFTTADGAATSTERMRLTSNGRLLLNTTDNSGYSNRSAYFVNPNDTWNYISITGATNGGAGIVFGDSTGQSAANYETYMAHSNVDNNFTLYTNQGNQRFTFTNTGCLGLGPNNTAPSAAIHSNDAGQQNWILGSTNAGGAYLVLDGDSNGDSAGGDYAYIGHDTNGDLILAVDNPAGNGNIFLKSNGASYQAVGCYESGEVQLRYQNTTKLETSSTGVVLTSGAANTTSVRFGNTANRGLYISTYQSAGNNDSGVVFNAADSENSGYSATLEFDLGGVEFGRFDGNYDIFKLASACNGITFNGDYAAANRLNDYEEGTWGANIKFGGASANIAHSQAAGRYTKVGRLVTCSFVISLTNKGTSTGDAYIFALPFTSTNDSEDRMWGLVTHFSPMTNITSQIVLYNTTNTTSIGLYDSSSTQVTAITDANFENNTLLRGFFQYHAA